MPPLYTFLYDLTMHCYWFYSDIFNQSEWSYLNYLIRDCIAFTQNRTDNSDLTLLYISTSIIKQLKVLESTK